MSETTPLTGEPLALDLVNTRTAEGDLLTTPARLRSWLELQAGRLPEIAAVTEEDLAAVHAVREHVAAAVDAVLHGSRPPAGALRGLNDAQRAAPSIRELSWAQGEHEGTIIVTTSREGTAGARVAAALAEAAADLLSDPALGKLRQCEAGDCVMVFLPAHPRRRWCSARRCGNRERVARYYRRHREV